MENKTYHGNQPEEIDADYIDQLLSAPAVPKKEPVLQPEPEPEPVVPETPTAAEPAEKPFPKALLILIAIALLGVGFLMGWLARGDREVPGVASTDTSTAAPTYDFGYIYTEPSTDPGIAVDYAAMSTKQLTDIAIQIRELYPYGGVTDDVRLTPDIYEKLKRENPVLGELEQRPDAVEQLISYNLVISSTAGHPGATALIEYYVGYLGFDRYPFELTPDCEWVVQDAAPFTVYEYTQAPSVYYTMDKDGSDITTVFDFGGCEFFLRGDPNWFAEPTNFWYRIEYIPGDLSFSSVPDPVPELEWTDAGDSTWATWLRCDQGWFVCGYAASKTDLIFTVYPSGSKHDILLTVLPVPEDGTDAAVLAQSLYDQASTLQFLSSLNPEKDLASYPIVAQLLEQPGGISVLLNLIQQNLPEMTSSTIDFRFSHALSLLSLPAFQSRMSSVELLAYEALAVGGYNYISCENLSEPAIAETSDGFPLTFIHGYHVGTPTEEPLPVPLSEMNFWAYIHLNDGAKILYQDNWHLNVRFDQDSCPVVLWPIYNSLTGQLDGWILCGKSEERITFQLDLMQRQATFLQSYQIEPRILDT